MSHVALTDRCYVVVSDSSHLDLIKSILPGDEPPDRTLIAVRDHLATLKNDDGSYQVQGLAVLAGGVTSGFPQIFGFGHPHATNVSDFSLGLVEGKPLEVIFNFLRSALGPLIRSEQDAIDFVVLCGQLMSSFPEAELSRSGTVAVARHDEQPAVLERAELKSARYRNRDRMRWFQQKVAAWPTWGRSK